MQVYKFGGSSLETAERMKTVAEIIDGNSPGIVVLSANGKCTDLFQQLGDHLAKKGYDEAFRSYNKLMSYYLELVDELFETEDYHRRAKEFIFFVFQSVRDYFNRGSFTETDMAWLLSRGELIATALFSLYLESEKQVHHYLDATEMIHLDESGQVDTAGLKARLKNYLSAIPDFGMIVTQGFVCTDHQGLPATLGRGGSDYTAALLGEACQASQVQIWSDVDGFLINDPSHVRGVLPLRNLSFDEAEELAYFGARILHPQTIAPAKVAGIPVLLKNTLNPSAEGTCISDRVQNGGIKAAASKDGICLIQVHSARMLLATGFLRGVFEVFEKYGTAVDMVTTSEVSVSITIDQQHHLEEILGALQAFGSVSWQKDLSILCIVGDQLAMNRGQVDQVFNTLRGIPTRMISYGAARNSISLLLETADKLRALEALNQVILQHIQNPVQHA